MIRLDALALECLFKYGITFFVRAAEETQQMLAEAARVVHNRGELGFNFLSEMFKSDPNYKQQPLLTFGKSGPPIKEKLSRPPVPSKPVTIIIQTELQDYLKLLLGWIFEDKMGLKKSKYRNWPLFREHFLESEATHFEEWDMEVEEVLPRQVYKGPHKGFEMKNLAARLEC